MAGGLGTRMRSSRSKHVHELLGRRLVDWVVTAARPLGAAPFVVVCSPETEAELRTALPEGVEVAVQREPRGTGDAAASARSALTGVGGDVLVLSGDTPLLTAELLADLLAEHRSSGAAVTVLSFEPSEPGTYGRILRDAQGRLRAIVEALDATPDELAVREVNSSIYVFAVEALWPALDRLDADNAKGELYLTDAVRHIVADGLPAAVFRASDPRAAEGVNTRVELARAASILRDRIVERHMLAGVAIVDPSTTWIEPDVEIEPDAVVHPFTVLRGRTVVRREAEVGPHVVAVDAEIGAGATIGPFCYLRPGTVLAAGATHLVPVPPAGRLEAAARVPEGDGGPHAIPHPGAVERNRLGIRPHRLEKEGRPIVEHEGVLGAGVALPGVVPDPGGVADAVPQVQEQSSEPVLRHGAAQPAQPVLPQAREVDALLEIHAVLSEQMARRQLVPKPGAEEIPLPFLPRPRLRHAQPSPPPAQQGVSLTRSAGSQPGTTNPDPEPSRGCAAGAPGELTRAQAEGAGRDAAGIAAGDHDLEPVPVQEGVQEVEGALAYVHDTPVKAGLADRPEDYDWSSYRACILGEPTSIDIDPLAW